MDRLIAARGSLVQGQWRSKRGGYLRAFDVRNRAGKLLALGALPKDGDAGFCIMTAKRYERDANLVQAVGRLTGIPVRL